MSSQGPPPLAQPPLAPEAKRRAAGWKIALIAVLLLGVVSVGIMITVGLMFHYTTRELTVTDEQRKALHHAADLVAWHDFDVDPDCEIWSAERLIDGSMSINYEYDDPAEEAPYISASLHHEPLRSDVLTTYSLLWQSIRLGTGLAESSIQIKEANHLFRWGDASRLGYLSMEGERYGMVFCMRKDQRVYLLVVSGVHLEEPAELEQFLKPKLEAMMALELGEKKK